MSGPARSNAVYRKVDAPTTEARPAAGGVEIADSTAQSPSGSIPSIGNGMSTLDPTNVRATVSAGVRGARFFVPVGDDGDLQRRRVGLPGPVDHGVGGRIVWAAAFAGAR